MRFELAPPLKALLLSQRATLFLLTLTVAFSAWIVPASAQHSVVAPSVLEPDLELTASPPVAVTSISEDHLEAFVDGFVRASLQSHRIAGATVAVVTPDDVLLLKGYGYANAVERVRVDPSEHLFRIASVTKTFTATAIMQLVEEGKLALDDDVRTHLRDFELDDHLGRITVANLLTHTPGFEDRIFNYYGSLQPGEGATLAEQVDQLGARQVRPPGTIISYSNFGFSLLGEIIARVSGESYADYLREHILDPLEMSSSDVRVKTAPDVRPLPWLDDLRSREARAHKWVQGWFEVTEFPPSRTTVQAEGTMSATAADMAVYMQMHLNRGRHHDTRILNEETWDQMSRLLFSHEPGMQGNAHGFWTDDYSGYAVLQHGGSINDFKTMLALVPELNLGIFVSGNTDSSSRLRVLPRMIVKHFFGEREFIPPSPPGDFAERAHLYTGTYLDARRNETRYERLIYTLYAALEVTATADGYLVLSEGGDTARYVESGEHEFASLEDGEKIRFRVDDSGQVRWLFAGSSGAFEPAVFLENPLTFLVPFSLAILGAIVWLVSRTWLLLKNRADANHDANHKGTFRTVERLTTLASAFWLLTLASGFVAFQPLLNDTMAIYEPFPTPAFKVHLLTIYATLGVTVGLVISLYPLWRGSAGLSRSFTAIATCLSMIYACTAISLVSWNLLAIN
ncbi:MAG: serine hydrolase domain-containing protein [Pseudomonadota bacterium]